MAAARKRILAVLGTRPEAIKLAPVLGEMRQHRQFETLLCTTGQHLQMLKPMLDLFALKPDIRLRLMRPGQSLNQLAGRLLSRLDEALKQLAPDAVLVQGDTTTAFAAALAAFHLHIPLGHVEAGLRTYDTAEPFPEEMNRQMVSRLAHWHFAPTESNAEQLRAEGVPAEHIFVTGNPVIDALQQTRDRCRQPAQHSAISRRLKRLGYQPDATKRLILVTGHRRESFGRGMEDFCRALAQIPGLLKDTEIAFPVHLNPEVTAPVRRLLGNTAGVHLLPPVDYEAFVWLMDRCWLLISDSGGVQEEAPALNKPVLVTRNCTERQEALQAGTTKLVGTDTEHVLQAVCELDANPEQYQAMAKAKNPYGDGRAARRIVAILQREMS